jgi:hypothetical protein
VEPGTAVSTRQGYDWLIEDRVASVSLEEVKEGKRSGRLLMNERGMKQTEGANGPIRMIHQTWAATAYW